MCSLCPSLFLSSLLPASSLHLGVMEAQLKNPCPNKSFFTRFLPTLKSMSRFPFSSLCYVHRMLKLSYLDNEDLSPLSHPLTHETLFGLPLFLLCNSDHPEHAVTLALFRFSYWGFDLKFRFFFIFISFSPLFISLKLSIFFSTIQDVFMIWDFSFHLGFSSFLHFFVLDFHHMD